MPRQRVLFSVDDFDGQPVVRWLLAWAGEVDASESPEIRNALHMGDEVDVAITGRIVGKHFKEAKDGGVVGIATIKPTTVAVNGEEVPMKVTMRGAGIIDLRGTNEILDEARRREAEEDALLNGDDE